MTLVWSSCAAAAEELGCVGAKLEEGCYIPLHRSSQRRVSQQEGGTVAARRMNHSSERSGGGMEVTSCRLGYPVTHWVSPALPRFFG